MKIEPSKRSIIFSHAEELSELKRQLEAKGESVIGLNVGQPSTGAPLTAIKKAQFHEIDEHGYTPAAGLQVLRERISVHYQEKYKLTVSPDRIIVTQGASGAFLLTFLGFFDKAQTVGLSLPCYYSYLNMFNLLGLNQHEVYGQEKNNFQPCAADLEQLSKTVHGFLITSPSNPTGAIIQAQQLEQLVVYCLKKNILLVSDEIYHGIAYDNQQTHSALEFSNEVVIIQ